MKKGQAQRQREAGIPWVRLSDGERTAPAKLSGLMQLNRAVVSYTTGQKAESLHTDRQRRHLVYTELTKEAGLANPRSQLFRGAI